VEAEVQGAGGKLCAPHCDSGACPTDVPEGTRARPQCILQDQSGSKYCALTCFVAGCPTGAKCAMVGGIMGVCVYPGAVEGQLLTLAKDTAEINI